MYRPQEIAAVVCVAADHPDDFATWVAEFLHARGLAKEFLEEVYGPLDDVGEDGA